LGRDRAVMVHRHEQGHGPLSRPRQGRSSSPPKFDTPPTYDRPAQPSTPPTARFNELPVGSGRPQLREDSPPHGTVHRDLDHDPFRVRCRPAPVASREAVTASSTTASSSRTSAVPSSVAQRPPSTWQTATQAGVTPFTSWCVISGEAPCLAGRMIRMWRS
jgi:hypothetical protein